MQKSNGVIWAALIVIVLMGAVIVVQQDRIQTFKPPSTVDIEIIEYSNGGDVVVSDITRTVPIDTQSLILSTESRYSKENNVTRYDVTIHNTKN